jgi:hypothetical protein
VRRERHDHSEAAGRDRVGHDFYVEDPDGNIIAFGGRPSEKAL